MPTPPCSIPSERRAQNEPSAPDRTMPLEWSKLLEMCGDEPDLISRILDTFVCQSQTDIESLAGAFDSRDSARVARLAHHLKGAAAVVGAEPLREEASRIETLGSEGQMQGALQCVSRLQDEFERFCGYVSDLPLRPDD